MPRTALTLRHVHFEELGHFRRSVEYARYQIAYSDLTPITTHTVTAGLRDNAL
jgi:hypothetical protein